MYKPKLEKAGALEALSYWRSVAIAAVALFTVLVSFSSSSAALPSPGEAAVQGYVDSVAVEGGVLTAQGWAGSADPSNKIVSVSIWFADTLVYDGRLEQFERPDVANTTGRSDWLMSGWRVKAALPDWAKGRDYPIRVQATLDKGGVGELPFSNQGSPVFKNLSSELASPREPVVQGYTESLVVEAGVLTARGWAGAVEPNDKTISVSIWVADALVYEGPFEQFERPDVVASAGRDDWSASGWRVKAELPDWVKSNDYAVSVQVGLRSGLAGFLPFTDNTSLTFVEPPQLSDEALALRIVLVVIFVLLLANYLFADAISEKVFKISNYRAGPATIFGCALLVSFFALVGLGITGSSMEAGFESAPFVRSELSTIWGRPLVVRSDEWGVFTPMAIAQYNHDPQFPMVNKNLGEEGQNMLVVGLLGVPVAHISVLAKPATWGFFLFDLKRALSWYWCFPIFACLFSLWGSVYLLLPGQWRYSFQIALLFGLSPYVAAWSNWPAYAVFFPAVCFICVIGILKFHNKHLLLALGCVLGVALSGFVLVLYPPWQVSLGYVFLALAVGVVLRDRLYRNVDKVRLASYGVAAIIAGFMLWQWWLDAQLGINAMLATVYPGQRASLSGGEVFLPSLLRGFSNFATLYQAEIAYSNQCEMASFFYMLLPLVMLFAIRIYQRLIGAVEFVLAMVVGFILCFMLFGIPVELAKISLWGRVPSLRADAALGLANIILCGVLLASGDNTVGRKVSVKLIAVAVAAIWSLVTSFNISGSPETILPDASPEARIALFSGLLLGGYWLALGRFREYMALSIAFSAVTIFGFNPVSIAPHSVTTASSFDLFKAPEAQDAGIQRTLVLQSPIAAMYVLASGVPVANGVFYYPQFLLWGRLDKNRTKLNEYNRYQHLSFLGGIPEGGDRYKIESPQPDLVTVLVDLEHFDFRMTSAGLLAAPMAQEEALKRNSLLSYIGGDLGWSWFRIKQGGGC